MAAIGVLAFAWWDLSWITIILLALGLGCLAVAFYPWVAARRLEKTLDDRGKHMELMQQHMKEMRETVGQMNEMMGGRQQMMQGMGGSMMGKGSESPCRQR